MRREETGASACRSAPVTLTPSAPASAANHRIIATIAASSQPLPWSVCWVLWCRSIGWLTVSASAVCSELEYVGLSFAPLARPLLSDCAPLLAEPGARAEARAAGGEAVAGGGRRLGAADQGSGGLVDAGRAPGDRGAPEASLLALVLSLALARSSDVAARPRRRSPSARAPAPAATAVVARARPWWPEPSTREAARQGGRPARARARARCRTAPSPRPPSRRRSGSRGHRPASGWPCRAVRRPGRPPPLPRRPGGSGRRSGCLACQRTAAARELVGALVELACPLRELRCAVGDLGGAASHRGGAGPRAERSRWPPGPGSRPGCRHRCRAGRRPRRAAGCPSASEAALEAAFWLDWAIWLNPPYTFFR